MTARMGTQQLVEALHQIATQSKASTTVHPQCARTINEVLPQLVETVLRPDSDDPASVLAVLDVITFTTSSAPCPIGTPILSAVLARVVPFLPLADFFRGSPSPPFLKSAVATCSGVLSILFTSDRATFDGVFRDAVLLATDTISLLKEARHFQQQQQQSPSDRAIAGSTLLFGESVPPVQVSCFGCLAASLKVEFSLRLPTFASACQTLAFCVSLCGSLISRFPYDVFRDAGPMWEIVERTLSQKNAFSGDAHRNAALGTLRTLLDKYPVTEGRLDAASSMILNACCDDSLDATLLSECVQSLCGHLSSLSVSVDAEEISEAIIACSSQQQQQQQQRGQPSAQSKEGRQQLMRSLLATLRATAKRQWLLVAPRLPSLLGTLFPSQFQGGVIACIKEVVARFTQEINGASQRDQGAEAIASAAAAAAGAAAQQQLQDEPMKKKRRGSSEEQSEGDAQMQPIDVQQLRQQPPLQTDSAMKPVEEAERMLAIEPLRIVADSATRIDLPLKSHAVAVTVSHVLDALCSLFLLPPAHISTFLIEDSDFPGFDDGDGDDDPSELSKCYTATVDGLPLTKQATTRALSLLSGCIEWLSIPASTEEPQTEEKKGELAAILSVCCKACCIVSTALDFTHWSPIAESIMSFLFSVSTPGSGLLFRLIPGFKERWHAMKRIAEAVAFFPKLQLLETRTSWFRRALKSGDECSVCAAARSLPVFISLSPDSRSLFGTAIEVISQSPTAFPFLPRYLGYCACATSLAGYPSDDVPRRLPYCIARFSRRKGFPWWVNNGDLYLEDSFLVPSCPICEANRGDDCVAALQQSPNGSAGTGQSPQPGEVVPAEFISKITGAVMGKNSQRLSCVGLFEGIPRLLFHSRMDARQKFDAVMTFLPSVKVLPTEATTQLQLEDQRAMRMSICMTLVKFAEFSWRMPESTVPMDFFRRLREECLKPNRDAQEALLAVFGAAGGSLSGSALAFSVSTIVLVILESSAPMRESPGVRNFASDQLISLARQKGVTLYELLRGCSDFVLREIIPYFASMPDTVGDFFDSFSIPDSFVREALPRFLPGLVLESASDREKRNALEIIGNKYSKSASTLCKDFMPQILCKLITTSDTSTNEAVVRLGMTPAFRFLEDICGESVQKIIAANETQLIGELTMLLCEDDVSRRSQRLFSAVVSLRSPMSEQSQSDIEEK